MTDDENIQYASFTVHRASGDDIDVEELPRISNLDTVSENRSLIDSIDHLDEHIDNESRYTDFLSLTSLDRVQAPVLRRETYRTMSESDIEYENDPALLERSLAKKKCGTLRRNKRCLIISFIIVIILAGVFARAFIFISANVSIVSVNAYYNLSSFEIYGQQVLQIRNDNVFVLDIAKIDISAYYQGSNRWYQLRNVKGPDVSGYEIPGFAINTIAFNFTYGVHSSRAASAILYQCQTNNLTLGWFDAITFHYKGIVKESKWGPNNVHSSCSIV